MKIHASDSKNNAPTAARKDSHLDVCLNEPVDYSVRRDVFSNGLDAFVFDHDALPEISKNEIDLSVTILGKKLSAPIIIGAMTGGTERAAEVNRRLALVAQKYQIGFALGSQRRMIESQESTRSYDVKKHAPKMPLLFGNLGAVQLNEGINISHLHQLIESVQCDAFNFHLNPLQEAVQPEGDVNFFGLIAKLGEIIPKMNVPVLFKEVGSGISETTAKKIKNLPIAGVETAGVGGTSWAKIEGLRAEQKSSLGELFAQWGGSTAESILISRKILGNEKTVIASGGIRNGIEIAKALRLGADAAAMAIPFLKAAEISVEALENYVEQVFDELRTALFVTGSANISALKTKVLKKRSGEYGINI